MFTDVLATRSNTTKQASQAVDLASELADIGMVINFSLAY